MSPELSRRLGRALGEHPVTLAERREIVRVAELIETFDELPTAVQSLVTEIEQRSFQDNPLEVVAAAETQTGAMIALVPSAADASRIAVDGGESPEQLHLTIGYLGSAAMIPPEVKNDIIDGVVECTYDTPTIVGDAFSVDMFNPVTPLVAGGEPCVTLGVSGEQLSVIHEKIMHDVEHVFKRYGLTMPEQHKPWVPHITLVYTNDADLSYFTDRTGPITFDHVRVAFAGDNYDIPIGESSTESTVEVDDEIESESDAMIVDNEDDGDVWDGVLTFGEDGHPLVPNVLIPLEALQERDVNVPGGPGHSLREYWVRGPGAAKIRWGTEGSMRRCIRQLGKYVRNPGGLCAEYHRAATGEWPRGGTVPSQGDTMASDVTVLYDSDQEHDTMIAEDTMAAVTRDDCPPGQHKMSDGTCMRDEDMSDDEYESMGSEAPWEGVLTVEGIESGDGRMFAPSALTWDEPPLPLMWQKETSHGGRSDVSVRVGNIDRIWRESDHSGRADVYFIKGSGTIDLGNPDGAEVFRRMKRGYMRGNSVDVDSVKDADVQFVFPEGDSDEGANIGDLFARPEVTVYTRGRIRATTLVEIPAFTEARLSLIDGITAAGESESEALAFRAVPSHNTPTTDVAWDSGVNVKRLTSPMTVETARNVFAWIDDSAIEDGMMPKSAGKLPHHEVSADGTPGAANLTACSAAIGALHGARGGVDIPVADRQAVYNHLARHIRDAGGTPPPFSATEQAMEAIVAATSVIEISDTPPREWFDEPTDVAPLGALTITAEGRVYGYVAPADTRHRSYQNRAQYVPMKRVDYSRFMGGETIVADGGRVATGNITMNCGHASTSLGLTASQAADHYDNTCSIVATVRVGENRNGVWVAGALLPDVTPEQVRRIMACRLSGDWRTHLDKSGWREFVAALLVPVPGFPMARVAPSVSTRDGELVASSVPVKFVAAETRADHRDTTRLKVAATVRRIREARAARVAEMRSRIAENNKRMTQERVAALRARINKGDESSGM